jgi:hypothetical protein
MCPNCDWNNTMILSFTEWSELNLFQVESNLKQELCEYISRNDFMTMGAPKI